MIKIPDVKVLEVEGSLAEEAAYELISVGLALGSEQQNRQVLKLFMPIDSSCGGNNLSEIYKLLSSYDCSVVADYIQSGCDYIQEFSKSWPPLVIGNLKINFIQREEASAFNREKDSIEIIPSTGFGTGHHPTTKMVLTDLIKLYDGGVKPTNVFDIGSGSGILAIAAAKLFSCKVIAWEIDPLAAQNADENFMINPVEYPLIKQFVSEFRPIGQKADLILANLYGELLKNYAIEIYNSLNSKGYCLVSGVTVSEIFSVKDTFSKLGFILNSFSVTDGWGQLRFIKK
jgi:ribosomal protein L11 methyltransferase